MTQGRPMLYACLTCLALIGLLAFASTTNAQEGKDENPVVILETSQGNIAIQLYPDKAPITVQNFLSYVDKGFFDGTIFHRVIDGFMIQGGGFSPDMREKPTERPIKNEASNGLSNKRGTISMARTNDPDSATAQFFINLVDNARGLDPRPGSAGYAVFGEVIEGMDVVDAIAKVRTGTRGFHQDVPTEPVLIKDAKRKAN